VSEQEREHRLNGPAAPILPPDEHHVRGPGVAERDRHDPGLGGGGAGGDPGCSETADSSDITRECPVGDGDRDGSEASLSRIRWAAIPQPSCGQAPMIEGIARHSLAEQPTLASVNL
jgi:hypothetical protein